MGEGEWHGQHVKLPKIKSLKSSQHFIHMVLEGSCLWQRMISVWQVIQQPITADAETNILDY